MRPPLSRTDTLVGLNAMRVAAERLKADWFHDAELKRRGDHRLLQRISTERLMRHLERLSELLVEVSSSPRRDPPLATSELHAHEPHLPL